MGMNVSDNSSFSRAGGQSSSLAVSSSHRQCTVSVLIIAELAMGHAGGAEILNQISALVGI